ncbi:metallophosphoesterase [Rhodocytophaga rosea]|uniref:Metallophosphoesterase n=1 Tax=Rhodocytophaga rosea TaxID=2704465 RepID=A0A6C0GET1_9BACT|nr:metallophosphoesterase [Rhodocytophaga rosea]QHT66485.1 metallophosphoesterase [Rhodocytophaga rosea]
MMKTIAHITDIHLDEDFPKEQGVDARENWKQILKDVAARNISDIVFGGDIGSTDSNEWFFASFNKYNFNPLLLTLGNHDSFQEVQKYYKPMEMNGTSELYYSFEDTYFRILYLDSSAERISDNQFRWLEQQLNTSKKILLYIHHPVLGVNTAIDKKYPLQGRERVRKVLQQHQHKVIIFCGHYHLPDVQAVENITQYVTPAASYQVERNQDDIQVNARTFGYRIIRIAEDKVNSEVVSFQQLE